MRNFIHINNFNELVEKDIIKSIQDNPLQSDEEISQYFNVPIDVVRLLGDKAAQDYFMYERET